MPKSSKDIPLNTCSGCGANLLHTKSLPICVFQGMLSIECPLCGYMTHIRTDDEGFIYAVKE